MPCGPRLFFGGELAAARPHLEQGMRLYEPQRHRTHAVLYSGHDPGVCCRQWLHCASGSSGTPTRRWPAARRRWPWPSSSPTPLTLVIALYLAAILHHLCREALLTQARAEAGMTIATEQGFPHQLAQAHPCEAGRWPRVGTGRRASRRSSRAWLPTKRQGRR